MEGVYGSGGKPITSSFCQFAFTELEQEFPR
jgi:hypothetical protein